MIDRKSSLFAVFAGISLVAWSAPLDAQFAQSPAATVAPVAPTAPETFDYELGTQSVNGATYTVKATQPVDSALKSQRVRFISLTPNTGGSTSKYFTVNTGKYKTVALLNALVREAFGKFLAGAPANAEVGKVGDIKYGGEIRFVVQSPEVLLYNTMTVGEPDASMVLTRPEVAAYASILASGKPEKK